MRWDVVCHERGARTEPSPGAGSWPRASCAPRPSRLAAWSCREAGARGRAEAAGSDGEVDLAARCNRCQKCVQACPYGIIQPLPLSLSVMNVGTPALSFKTGYCDFCMKCVEACPTGARCAPHVHLRRHRRGEGRFRRCVAWHWAGCTVCVDECPVEGAISLDDLGRPRSTSVSATAAGDASRCAPSSLRSYDASVAAKGIYVVPRSSRRRVARAR